MPNIKPISELRNYTALPEDVSPGEEQGWLSARQVRAGLWGRRHAH